MARMLAFGLAMLILLAPAARADETAAPPPCCCCKRHDEGRRQAMIMGLSLLGTGYALTLAHAQTQPDVRGRLELVPLAGPVLALARNDTQPFWTTALTFGAWSQVMGLMVLMVALTN